MNSQFIFTNNKIVYCKHLIYRYKQSNYSLQAIHFKNFNIVHQKNMEGCRRFKNSIYEIPILATHQLGV